MYTVYTYIHVTSVPHKMMINACMRSVVVVVVRRRPPVYIRVTTDGRSIGVRRTDTPRASSASTKGSKGSIGVYDRHRSGQPPKGGGAPD